MTKPKNVLITGCSSGIGQSAAEILKNRGYRVFASARKPQDVQALQTQGFESILLDLNDSTSIQNAVKEVIERTNGNLDALINNAGYGQIGAIEDQTRETMLAQFETNVFGLQELTNYILPIMRKQGHGRIINLSSVLGLVSLPYLGLYSASKFALEALTDALRLELKGSGIHISLIEPGPITSHFRETARKTYEKDIDINESVHKEIYRQMIEKRTTAKEPFTLEPNAVVKKIIHALESPRPKIRYYVTAIPYFLSTFKRILPYRTLDWVVSKF